MRSWGFEVVGFGVVWFGVVVVVLCVWGVFVFWLVGEVVFFFMLV